MIGAAAIRTYLEARKGEIIDQIAHVVNIDSPTFPSGGNERRLLSFRGELSQDGSRRRDDSGDA